MIEPELNFPPEPEPSPKIIVLPPPREIARALDPATSKIAAYRCAPNRGTMAWAVLRVHYRNRAGLTDDQVRSLLAISIYDFSHRKRRNELHRGALLEDSGTLRPTRTGAPAIVWRITAKGIEYFESKARVELIL